MARNVSLSHFHIQQGSHSSISFFLSTILFILSVYEMVTFFSFPNQAELVSMTLRWLPEDITVHNEDLEGLLSNSCFFFPPSFHFIHLLGLTHFFFFRNVYM